MTKPGFKMHIKTKGGFGGSEDDGGGEGMLTGGQGQEEEEGEGGEAEHPLLPAALQVSSCFCPITFPFLEQSQMQVRPKDRTGKKHEHLLFCVTLTVLSQ